MVPKLVRCNYVYRQSKLTTRRIPKLRTPVQTPIHRIILLPRVQIWQHPRRTGLPILSIRPTFIHQAAEAKGTHFKQPWYFHWPGRLVVFTVGTGTMGSVASEEYTESRFGPPQVWLVNWVSEARSNRLILLPGVTSARH